MQAIDVWMGVCTAFVFAALVEFTFVNYMWRKSTSAARKMQSLVMYRNTENGCNALQQAKESIVSAAGHQQASVHHHHPQGNPIEAVEMNMVSMTPSHASKLLVALRTDNPGILPS